MRLPLSTPLASRFEFLDQCGSTNSELVARAADAWPDFSVLVSADQTAGRGRLGRVWVAPPGQSLAVSVLLRPRFALGAFGWLPLMAGLAMARAVDAVLGGSAPGESVPGGSVPAGSAGGHSASAGRAEVAIKWPNDVQVGGLKVSGLLSELLPDANGVVVGAGLNLSIPSDRLPTAQSTSLHLWGASENGLFDRALAVYLTELRQLYRLFAEHDGDAAGSGIRRMVEERCGTLGQQVRVELPNGAHHFGRATGLDSGGQLLYRDDQDGTVQAVAAGDVTHLRYE